MLVEFAGMSPRSVHQLMGQVVPRPIAWVVSDNGATVDAAERWNLAPFSYFNSIASDPPAVMFSVGFSPRDGSDGVKDTLANITARSQHTIALPHRAQSTHVQATSAEVPFGESEFGLVGLEPVEWEWAVPRPAGARVALGCTVDRIVPVADGPQRVVLARVEKIWIDDAIVSEDARGRPEVDPMRLDPLMRLGSGVFLGISPVKEES